MEATVGYHIKTNQSMEDSDRSEKLVSVYSICTHTIAMHILCTFFNFEDAKKNASGSSGRLSTLHLEFIKPGVNPLEGFREQSALRVRHV